MRVIEFRHNDFWYDKENLSMSKAIFKTLAVLAAAATFMLPGANRNTFAADAPPTAADVIGYAKQRLAAYKVPKTVEIVAEIPRTAATKVSRSALVAERASRKR